MWMSDREIKAIKDRQLERKSCFELGGRFAKLVEPLDFFGCGVEKLIEDVEDLLKIYAYVRDELETSKRECVELERSREKLEKSLEVSTDLEVIDLKGRLKKALEERDKWKAACKHALKAK